MVVRFRVDFIEVKLLNKLASARASGLDGGSQVLTDLLDDPKLQKAPSNYEGGNTQRPEVCVVTWNSDELATDALPINGFEHYKENDFVANAPFLGNPRISCILAKLDKAERVLCFKSGMATLATTTHLFGTGAFSYNVPGTFAKDVMDMVLVTRYFDTMKEISASSKSAAIFVPH
ncbi:hypothetical protein ACET3Z_021205 [Daucus carota]